MKVHERKGKKREERRVEIISRLGREYDKAMQAKNKRTRIKKLYLVHKQYKEANMRILAQKVARQIALIKKEL